MISYSSQEPRHFADKGLYSQSCGFSSRPVWAWKLDHKGGWAPKNGCFWTVVLEKTLENPLDSKEIKPAHPKGNPAWIFIGRTDAEAEAPILHWTWCEEPAHWKRPWCWERLKIGGERGNIGWDGWMVSLTQWTWVWANPRDGEGQGSLACCTSWGCKESHIIEWLSNSNNKMR